MIQQPLKTWTFTDYSGINKVVFDGENLQKKLHGTEHSINLSPRKMLTYDEYFAHYKTDCAILKYLASSYKYDHNQFNQKDEKHWRFWRYIYLSKIPNLTLKATPKYSYSEPFLEISPEGVCAGIFNFKKEKEYHQHYRFDYLFFNGPKLPGLSLDDRKMLRQIILDALSLEANFSLQDAFPLFDYSKIPMKKWEYSDPNSSGGGRIEITPSGYLSIEDFINPRDSYLQDFSFEEIWTKKPNFVGQYNPEVNEWIAQHFENAIIQPI